jgi:peptidyl-prolyl cis-trans isomerase D
MLTFIRERAQGWIAWVIVGLLIIPFALWGINEYFGTGGRLAVATVNGTEISQREFQQVFYEQRDRMQQMLGQQYDSRIFDPRIKQQVIDELVERELLLQYADEHGYRVSEQVVAATIRNLDAFREAGVFSAELYRQNLQIQGQSPASFERRVHRLLLSSQLPDGITRSVLVTNAELDAAVRLQEQTRDLRYLVLPLAKFRDESVADEAAIQAYYEEHADRYMTAEQAQVEYVELSAANLTTGETSDEPNEEKLREFYQSQASQYSVPEERQARHILIQLEEGADEVAVEAVRKQAEEVVAKLQAGESFDKLAKQHSDDPGSSDSGGDLGYFGRGTMEPDFEKTVFEMKPGEISKPVLTSFGYHIIKLENIRPATSKPFETVRDEILSQYQRDAAERKYFELAEQLTNLAYETPDSLADVAGQLELEIKQSPFIGRQGGVDLFANPQVTAAVYSDDVLNQGYNSEPIEVGENHVVVLRLLEHQEARRRSLDEVQEQVKTQFIQHQAREHAEEAGLTAVKQLQSGEAPDSVAGPLGVDWQTAKAVGRQGRGLDRAIVDQVFRSPRPASGPSIGSVSLGSGDYAVILLEKVIDGDPASLDEAGREDFKRRLADAQAAAAYRALIDTLKRDARIHVQKDEL